MDSTTVGKNQQWHDSPFARVHLNDHLCAGGEVRQLFAYAVLGKEPAAGTAEERSEVLERILAPDAISRVEN